MMYCTILAWGGGSHLHTGSVRKSNVNRSPHTSPRQAKFTLPLGSTLSLAPIRAETRVPDAKWLCGPFKMTSSTVEMLKAPKSVAF